MHVVIVVVGGGGGGGVVVDIVVGGFAVIGDSLFIVLVVKNYEGTNWRGGKR